MKFPERVATVVLLAAAGISLSVGSASGGPIGNPAGSGYYYQPPHQQQQGQQWYGQQQQQYGYEEWEQQQQEQNQPEENAGVDDDDENPLPPGWSEHIDPSSGQPYYYNANDGTTTWDRPMLETTVEDEEELQKAPKEDVYAETTMELDADEEIKEEPRGELIESSISQQYSSAGESHLSDAHQSDHEPRAETEPIWGQKPTEEQPQQELQQPQGWGMPADEPLRREERQQQGWGMPQQEQKPAEWNVRREEMRKPEPEYRRDPVQKPPVFLGQPDRGFEQLQQQRDRGRDPLDKSRMYQEDPVERKKPEQQPPAYEQLRDWQREMPKQEEAHRPTSATFGERPDMGPPGSQPPIAQEQRPAYQPQYGQPIQQRPPFQQQAPPEQQLGLSQQQKVPPQQRQQIAPQQQQQPFQPARSQNQMPPWQQQQQQAQRPQQQQQGPPRYGQQGPYGQYDGPPGQGYGQYGQHGGAPPGFGQQRQNQLVVQSETAGAVKEALGSAWKGILGFGNRTKEVVGQAKETVISTATAAGQTISATSQGILGQAKSSLNSVFEGSGDGNVGPQHGYSLTGNYGAPPAPGQYAQQQQGYPSQQYGGYPGYQPQPREIPPYPHQPGQQGQQQPPVQSQWGFGAPQQRGQPQSGQPQQGYPPRQQGPYGQGPQGQHYPPSQGGPQQRQQGPPSGQKPPTSPGQDPSQHPGWGSGY